MARFEPLPLNSRSRRSLRGRRHICSRPARSNLLTGGMTSKSTHPAIHLYDFKFRFWPILLAALVMHGILTAGREAAKWIYLHGPAAWEGQVSIFFRVAL